jgi:hypothetical protein
MQQYQPGAQQVANSANFLDFYSALKEQRDDNLMYPFGNQRFTDLADLFFDRKHSEALAYIHFERDRNHPKIKATNAGAGGAGAAVVFTLHADAINSIPYNSPAPPYTAGTTTVKKSYPVKVGDVIQIKPSSGVVGSGAYINAKVTAIDTSADTFTAVPRIAGQSIPSVSVADEIIILFNEIGNGGPLPKPESLTVSEYKNSMNQMGYRAELKDHGEASRTWFKDKSGTNLVWTPNVLKEHLDEALNRRELMNLLGDYVTNTTLTELAAASDHELTTGNGLIPEMLARSNMFEYSAVTGPTYNWFRNIAMVLSSQKGSMYNMFLMGQMLRSAINKMNLNELQGGTISLGQFSADQDKFVSLSFKRIEVDGYYFDLKTMPSFNDLQTLGAAGYGYPGEGMIFPERLVVDGETGSYTTPVRTRYCTDTEGRDMSMRTTYWSGFESDPDGRGVRELRFKSMSGLQLMCANQTAYVRKSQA